MEDNSNTASTGRGFYVDLESGPNNSTAGEASSTSSAVRSLFHKVCSAFVAAVDGVSSPDELQKSLCGNSDGEQAKLEGVNEASSGSDHSEKQQQRRKSSSPHKKSPKPPRPPRGPSLDAADIKLIKEISELAMLKRARIERIKALKKAKAAKASSASSTGNLFAMVFTVLFFLVIICQGMSSRITAIELNTAPEPARTMDNNNELISVQYFGNPSVNGPIGLQSGSHNLVEQQRAGFDPPDSARSLD
ncbi:hypothetical protein LINGRAHAP2_LOCUS6171 [Linum grandiflorum]